MAGFSKFEPHRPVEAAPEAVGPSAARRVRFLRWVNWIVLAYTAVGFGFIVHWMVRGP
ncbi:MAG TPA: hypothetical protein VHI93_07330 [Candidatus Thermoplasmatota archaeon]|nr:hypothetical protein [Candidatus Thermoplasmatota archaeon]